MLIAALCAEGTSVIGNIGQIDRGYERIDERLRALGASIERIGSSSASAPPLGWATLRTVVAAGTGPANVSARVELGVGEATVSTGLSVLDYLVGRARPDRPAPRLARGGAGHRRPRRSRRPGVRSARRSHRSLRAPGASGCGYAWLPADEALAGAVLEITDRPLVASNVDFSGQRVGGLGSDVVARFLDELAAGAGLNVHIRVLEGRDPEHVLRAIFKALGAAIGQACRTAEGGNR